MRLPVVILLLCLLLESAVDWYGWAQVKRCVRTGKAKWSMSLFFFTTVISFACLLILAVVPRRAEDTGILISMWALYGWLSLFLFKLCHTIFSLIGRILHIFHKSCVDLGVWAGLPLGAAVFIGMWWGALFNVRDLEVTETDIVSPKITDNFDGYRIVQFSDAHVGTWGTDTTFVSALVDSINSLSPDLIVFTGDIVNRRTSEIEPFIPVLSRLEARDGVYSILGNHDYGDYISWKTEAAKARNMADMYRAHERMGWILLDNRNVSIVRGNDSISLIGAGNWGEPPFHVYGSLSRALVSGDTVRATGDRRFRILLSHNPEHWRQEVAPETDIELTLSGHTHAMQMSIGSGRNRWSPAGWKYDQWGGLYSATGKGGAESRIYVNIGCGEVGMPARIGTAFPEITLITLRKKTLSDPETK